VRADVRLRAAAADVLFPRLQGEHVGAFAVRVHRLTDEPAGQLPHQLLPYGHVTEGRSPVRQRIADRLSVTDRDVGTVVAGCFEHGEAERIRDRHEQRPDLRGPLPEGGHVLEVTEAVRLLGDHAGGFRVQFPGRVSDGAVEFHGGNFDVHRLQVRAYDLTRLRVDAPAERHVLTAGLPHRQQRRFSGGACPVVHAGVRDRQAGQFGNHRLILEGGLEYALGHLRLVRGVGGDEFTLQRQVARDARNEVFAGTAPDEAGSGPVFGGEFPQVVHDFEFRLRGADFDVRVEQFGGNVGEQVSDAVNADALQGAGDVSFGVRGVLQASSSADCR